MAQRLTEAQKALLAKTIRQYEEDNKPHRVYVDKVDRWYRAWRGVLERSSDANAWRSRQHQAYIMQIIYTLMAGHVDTSPRWKIKPRPRASSPDEIEQIREGAKQLEWLLAYQRDNSDMLQKQFHHRLQGNIAGLTLWKSYWSYLEREQPMKRKVYTVDEQGNPIVTEKDDVEVMVTHDDPVVEVVDVRDWIPHQAARTVQSAQRIHHRLWYSFDDLKRLEADGYFSVPGAVDLLKESRDHSEMLANRENDLFQRDRTKDQIMLVEHWIDNGARVITTGNLGVLLDVKDNPFEHGEFPFTPSTPNPDLFSIYGVSTVEMVEEIQEMIWTLQNQRLDNLELVNNAIVRVSPGVENPGRFVHAPGEVWLAERDEVEILYLNADSSRVSLEAEALLKSDLQNIPGAAPALLGQSGDMAQTATEVSIMTNLASKRLALQKFQFTLGDAEVGAQWIKLNQQFLDEERWLRIVGDDGQEGWELITPDSFKGENWGVDVEQADESIVRQERLAEAQARFQVAVNGQQALMLAGSPPNMRAFMEDLLEAGGVQNTDRYFSPGQPVQGGAQAPPTGPQNGPAPDPQAVQEGITSLQATDPNSPSNAFSQSPVAAMQRMLAGSGGAVNGGL